MRHAMRGISLLLALTALVLLGGLGSARADVVNFTISNPNTALSSFTATPYVSVSVNRTSTTMATITFTSDTATSGNADCTVADPCTYEMGGAGAADVNVNASSFTVGSITDNGVFTSTSSGTVDGFGSFNLNINNFDGFSDSATSISFVLTNTSGTWTTASDVLTANSSGSTVAAHVFVSGNLCTGACVTGYGGNAPPVPEPGTMALFGTGLLVLGGSLRRFLSRTS